MIYCVAQEDRAGYSAVGRSVRLLTVGEGGPDEVGSYREEEDKDYVPPGSDSDCETVSEEEPLPKLEEARSVISYHGISRPGSTSIILLPQGGRRDQALGPGGGRDGGGGRDCRAGRWRGGR